MPIRTALAVPARYGSLAAGMLPVLAFPALDLAPLAWVGLLPGLLLFRAAPRAREAAVRGWWFGTGYVLAAMYWLLPSVGPALPVIALVFGVLQTGLGAATWALLRPPLTARRALAALVVLPSLWVVAEFARSWQALGGPWALLGATQWQHPAVLALASIGGVWLLSAAVVAVNTAVLIVLIAERTAVRIAGGVTAAALLLAGPLAFALTPAPRPVRTTTLALVQPGITPDGPSRLAASARLTAELTDRPDLVVWGESSVTTDLARDTATLARLRALSAATGSELLVNEDARKADGTISKDAVLIDPAGVQARYAKMRLVPFGEYIPFRSALGWLTGISKAAAENRTPGHSFHLFQPVDRTGRPLPTGVLICFESAFPDLSRTATLQGAQLIVYQSATSTFQHSWAPAQHASLAALRAAETGRPVVQAALTGVSVAFDAQGRELARYGTGQRGVLTVHLALPAPSARTWYDRVGDVVPWTAVTVTLVAAAVALRSTRRRPPRAALPAPAEERHPAAQG
ncbi:apolipoprotein N-acyltransferase [Kitasatospora sp. NBC_01287]|uniref:apolipoprotein N-acyltransferase n=1 Tax=Kitasatospora sp. NBC_01287 TaxID=2903573 RepID=UPI00224CC3F3|nr:apolipoprotein N-acyltransferase [Kitasatospora sp. NBC_01287]MCX4750833.1 apolipoprotein N-acyltransferase [Kitasatospora sp. NBC_01287]